MYISKVKIKNYRSIKDLTINFNPDKNIISNIDITDDSIEDYYIIYYFDC